MRTTGNQPVTSEVIEDIKKNLLAELNKKRAKEQASTSSRRINEVKMSALINRGHNAAAKRTKPSAGGSTASSLSVAYQGPMSDSKERRCKHATISCP